MSLASLTVKISADISELQKAMGRASKAMEETGKKMTSVGKTMSKSLTAPIMALGASVLALQKKTGDYADKLLDLEEITGISTTSLQEFRHVATVAGVSTDALSNTVSGLARRMPGIIDGTGNASDALKQLGVSAKDVNGNVRQTEDIMVDIMGALGGVENRMERAAIANQLLGRSWQQLAPVIGLGADGIKNARDEAHELGLVLDRDALESANNFRIEFEKFQAQIASAGRAIAVELMPVVLDLLPVFQSALKSVVEMIQRFSQLEKATQMNVIKILAITAAIGPMLIVVGKAVVGIGKMVTVVKALNTVMLKNPFVLIGAGLLLVFNRAEKANKESRKLIQTVRELGKEGGSIEDLSKAIEAQEQLIEAQKKQVLETHRDIGARNKAKEKLQRYQDALADLNAELGRQQLAFSESLIEQRKQVEIADEVVDAYNNISSTSDKISTNVVNDVRNIEGAYLSLKRVIQEVNDAMTKPVEKTFKDLLGDRSAKGMGTVNVDSEKFPKEMRDALQRTEDIARDKFNILSSIANDFTSSFGQGMANVVVQGERLVDVLKNIGKLLLSAAIQKGISLLLSGGLASAGTGFFGSGGGILGKLFGTATSVNDALITSGGNVVKFHPNDSILAMKDFSKLGAMGGGQRVEVFGKISGQDIFISSDRGGSSFNR